MILYSENRLYYFWNAVVVASAIFLAFYIPISLRFNLESFSLLTNIYWIIEVVFLADAIVQFVRLRKSGNSRSTYRSRIIRWFLVDVIAAFPFRLIPGTAMLEYLRLTKMATVAQFIRQFREREVRFSISLTLILFFFWVVLLIHWLSCGWMGVYGVDASQDMFTNYVSALYWTVSTLTSVGYGDIVPVTNGQRLYAVMVQLTGFGVLGYLVGKVVSIISRTDQVRARYEENIELFTTAIRRRTLPQDLQKRILAYYTYLRDQKVGYDESAFLRGLPESLRTEVELSLKKEFIEGIPLFREASEKFIVEIALKLELIVVTPGATLLKAGDTANEMYFIISGDLEVLNKEGAVIAALKEGDFFGEIALFKKRPRSATVRAVTYCNLYKLERHMFEEVIANHPEVAAQIREVASARERRSD